MAKSGLVISLSFAIMSGCALFDSSETVVEKNKVSVPTGELQSPPVMSTVEARPPAPAITSSLKKVTPDAIRRLQVHLRGVGLDPGRIDGAAGPKTKAAFGLFQSGCAQVQAMRDASQAVAQTTKRFSREETLKIQTELRAAGFNPGPADGVFGDRTKSVLVHLRDGCPMIGEFAGLFDSPGGGSATSASVGQFSRRQSATQSVAAQSRLEAAKRLDAPVVPRSQEDVRILQLRLRDAGFDPGPFDGVMGPKTRLAMQQLRASQQSGKSKTALTLGPDEQY